MLSNNNGTMTFNNFSNITKIPSQVFTYLIKNKTDNAENFWKALYYPDNNPLNHAKLTSKQKRDLIWRGAKNSSDTEDNYKIFNKPLVADNMINADSMIQCRMFRYGLIPVSQNDAVVLFEIDSYSSVALAYMTDEDGDMVERTDYLEIKLLTLLNGVDLGYGYEFMQFNQDAYHSSKSTMNINNSKAFYGRGMILVLRWSMPDVGVDCV